MIQMNSKFQHRNVLGNHLEIPQKLGIKVEKHINMKDYLPYINNFADLPTILEAYQYLMKRYVMNARERKRKWLKAKNASRAISAFKQVKELRFQEPDQIHPVEKRERNLQNSKELEDVIKIEYPETKNDEYWHSFMSEQTGTEIFARYKKEMFDQSDDSDSSYEEPPLNFEISEESARLTKTILEQFDHLNTGDPIYESSNSRKSSVLSSSSDSSSKSRKSSIWSASSSRRPSVFSLGSYSNSNTTSRRSSIVVGNASDSNKRKTLERRKSLMQIQNREGFQPKEEEKLLLKYRKSARRPSSFF